MTLDPTRRFSDRVANYVRFRPGYPEGVVALLQQETGLTPTSVIADLGSGTGISAELFLRNGNPVFGVEPNPDMRRAAEQQLQSYPQFYSIAGTAEATTLPSHSIDYVVAAQAFHWFNSPATQLEFSRILRDHAWVVLMWNSRRIDSTPFLQAYENLLQQYGTDYREVQHKTIDQQVLQPLFADGQLQLRQIYNEQRFDYRGLQGRLLSSSYTPTAGHPNFQPMLDELEYIFEQYAEKDTVCFEYDTEIYFGRLARS